MAPDAGYDTPEAAACSTFPPQHCRVVASAASAEDAYVLLDVGAPGQPYLYGCHCVRRDERWFESGSSNGPDWMQSGPDPERGTLVLWGETPSGADCARIHFDRRVIDVPGSNGVFLAAWWRVESPSEWPEMIGYRVHGIWHAT